MPVLAPAQTRIRGGSACFGQDVVSELPFLETRVDFRGRTGDMVLTDGERLISFVREVSMTIIIIITVSSKFRAFFFLSSSFDRASLRSLKFMCSRMKWRNRRMRMRRRSGSTCSTRRAAVVGLPIPLRAPPPSIFYLARVEKGRRLVTNIN